MKRLTRTAVLSIGLLTAWAACGAGSHAPSPPRPKVLATETITKPPVAPPVEQR
jgi:hypothetical protein